MAGGDRFTRGTFLKKTGAASAAALGRIAVGELRQRPPAVDRRQRAPIRHLVISCQENRSFDHYCGYAPQVQAKGFGPPDGYIQPDGTGGHRRAFEFTQLSTPALPHSWTAVRRRWDGGEIDGCDDGRDRSRLLHRWELPFYYGLFDNSALCTNYFCSLLGPTWPNRFYLCGDLGWNHQQRCLGLRHLRLGPGRSSWICLTPPGLAGASTTDVNWDSVPIPELARRSSCWKNFAHDRRTLGEQGRVPERRAQGNAAAGVVARFELSPTTRTSTRPADVSVGMRLQQELITALRKPRSGGLAFLLTYDEHGGYFDHVRRPNSTPTGWASACRSGSSRPSQAGRRNRESRPSRSTLKLIERCMACRRSRPATTGSTARPRPARTTRRRARPLPRATAPRDQRPLRPLRLRARSSRLVTSYRHAPASSRGPARPIRLRRSPRPGASSGHAASAARGPPAPAALSRRRCPRTSRPGHRDGSCPSVRG